MSTTLPITPSTPSAAPIAWMPLPRLDESSAGLLMTPEEFDAITDYDDCFHYELIHGVLVVNPIPGEGQASPNDELGHLLRTYKQRHPQGAALDTTMPERYVRTLGSRRLADRVIWAGMGRLPSPKVDVPQIVVEFVSAGKRSWQRDYIEKRREYADVGVQEYWIVDRFRRAMTVVRNTKTGAQELVVGAQEIYRTELLPGFELPIASLLAEADIWENPS